MKNSLRILAIETSCDETAVAVLECKGGLKNPRFKILGQAVHSQISDHAQFGGVVPSLAKREHGKNLVPVLAKVLKQAKMEKRIARKNPKDFSVLEKRYKKILEREPELLAASLSYLPKIAPPKIDAIAVTMGPGLEPALWVGINFAKTLSEAWQKPLAPINHMEGHIVSALSAGDVRFPALSLLVSGGHTELVLMKNWFSYKMLGATRDDAVGEAFDKTARLLGLPYPGGPEISRLAELHREAVKKPEIHLPRPMIDSLDFDFSFAGLKTAVRYLARDLGEINNVIRAEVAREFEDAAVETLAAKAEKAVKKFKPRTLIVAGGVSANIHLRRSLGGMIKNFPKTKLLVPDFSLSGDNAVMVAMAAYLRIVGKKKSPKKIAADGNLALR